MNDNNDKFTTDVRKVLGQSVQAMDSKVEQRLAALKYRALDAPAKTAQSFYRWSSVAVAAIIAVITFVSWPQQSAVKGVDLVTLEIVGEPDALDFFQHDMEFYQWLSEEIQNENTPTSSYYGHGIDSDLPAIGRSPEWNRRYFSAEYRDDRVSGGVQG